MSLRTHLSASIGIRIWLIAFVCSILLLSGLAYQGVPNRGKATERLDSPAVSRDDDRPAPSASAQRPMGRWTAPPTVGVGRSASSHPAITPASTAPSLNGTLDLTNRTYTPGNYLAPNTPFPEQETYDSGKGELFVAGWFTNTICVINTTTNRVVAWIPLSGLPEGLAYDSQRGEVFVAAYTGNVSIINDTTNRIVATVEVGEGAFDVAYDNVQGEVFVTNSWYNHNVTVINDTNDSIAATIYLDDLSQGIAYDSGTGEIWVATYNYVDVIAPRLNAVVASYYSPGVEAYGVAYLSGENEICVTYPALGKVVVLSDTNTSEATAIAVGQDPMWVTYDPDAVAIVVVNYGSENLTVISAITDTVGSSVPETLGVLDVVDDGANGELYVTESYDASVSVLSDSNFTLIQTVQTGSFPNNAVYDSGRSETFVSDLALDTVSVISDPSNTVVASISIPNGARYLAYDSGTGEVYASNYQGENVTVISDSTNTVIRTIDVGAFGPAGVVYDNATGQIFIAVGGLRELLVLSDRTDTVVDSFPIGSIPEGVALDTQSQRVFVANEYSDNVSVVSAVTDSVLGSIPVPGGPSALAYDSATGDIYVAAGRTGNVTVISGANDTIVHTITGLGAQFYGTNAPILTSSPAVLAEPEVGELVVTDSVLGSVSFLSDVNDSVLAQVQVGAGPGTLVYDPHLGTTYVLNEFQGTMSELYQAVPPPEYGVNFTEAGLPVDTPWSVTLGGAVIMGDSETLSTQEWNGTYNFTVSAVSGYVANRSGGFVTVSGAAVAESIKFSVAPAPAQYTVTFEAMGLPASTAWTVSLDGSEKSSSSAFINFTVGNGNHSFSVGAVAGYRATPDSGTVVVVGSDLTQSISFVAASTSVSAPTLLGLPPIEAYVVFGAIGLVVVLAVVGALLVRRRGGASPTTPAVGSAPPGAGPSPPGNS